MKQYTTPEQASKLIELGLFPKHIREISDTGKMFLECCGFSIGELISILPSTVGKNYDLHIEFSVIKWYVAYYWIGNGGEYYIKYEFSSCELIDALYMMILRLKEEGAI